MIEFDVDMGYLLENGELDKVVLIDENGEHDPIEFTPANTKQVVLNVDAKDFVKSLTGEQLQKIADGMKES